LTLAVSVNAMLKPLVLAAALTVGYSTLAAAVPIPSTSTILSDTTSVSRIRHVRATTSASNRHRTYTIIALYMGGLASLIVGAILWD
jgi:hypothetical protein